MRLVSVALCMVAAASVCRADTRSGGPRPDDYPFQCGAAFGLVSRAYEDAGNVADATRFNEKAKKLELLAEAEFARRGRSKQDAESYMQKHIDDLIKVGIKEPRLLAHFVRLCEQRFPS